MSGKENTGAIRVLDAAEIELVSGGGTLLSDYAPPAPPPPLDGHINPNG